MNYIKSLSRTQVTSNKTVDPEFTKVFTTGLGTAITNNAYYAIRTNAAGTLDISVTGYASVPADLTSCTGLGIELSLYQASSCPTAQAYPTPVAYRTFSGNGALSSISGLLANTNYLVMVDGISNTKATFNLAFGGTTLPIVLEKFTGVALSGYNQLVFKLSASSSYTSKIIIEKSADGRFFSDAMLFNITSLSYMLTEKTWKDLQPFAEATYYRLKFVDLDGTITHSKIISLTQLKENSFVVVNNPVNGFIDINWNMPQQSGILTLKLMSSDGKLLKTNMLSSTTGADRIDISQYAAGLYYIIITDAQQQIINKTKVVKQ